MLQLLLKRGTTALNSAYTGNSGEITVDTQLGGIRLHDGSTPGGLLLPTASDKTKLNGIEANATANASDLYLLSRANHSGTQAISTITNLQTTLDGKINSSLIGAEDGVAPLNSTGKIDTAFLPSYVDDVIEAANFAALPGTGETGKIYVTLNDNKTYRWSGSAYVEISAGGGTADTANTLATPRTINGTAFDGSANITTSSWGTSRTLSFTGDATGSNSVDGSGNVGFALTLANSGVTAGTYNNVATEVRPFTVDAKGRVTGIGSAVTITPAWASITSKPTTIVGYGITDAVTLDTTQTVTGAKTFSSIAGPTASKGTATTALANTGFVAQVFTTLTTTGTLDWNDDTNTIAGVGPTLLTGSTTNGPGTGSYFHPLNIHYNSANNRTQIAIGYNTPEIHFRYRLSGTWSNWTRLLNSSNSGSLGLTNGTSSLNIPTADTNIIATTAGVERLRITSGGALATGADTAPDVDAGGLCLQQNANSGNVLTLKSTSVTQPFTSLADADTYLYVRKTAAATGGANFTGFSSLNTGLFFRALATTPLTSYTQAGVLTFDIAKSDGSTGRASLAATENALIINNNNAAIAGLKGDGSLIIGGSVSTGGEVAPDVSIGGLCLQQGTADSLIHTWKSTDVAHGMTSVTETDTFFSGSKLSATDGGAFIRGYTAGSDAVFIRGYAVTPTSGLTRGAVHLDSMKRNGTSADALANGENILSIGSNSAAKVVVLGSGTIITAGSFATGSEIAPDTDVGGLCLQQGTGTGNIATLKSTSVAHPFTAIAETDTYAQITKANATSGGLSIRSFASTGVGTAASYFGYAQQPNTALGNHGIFSFNALKTNGTTGSTNIASTELALTVNNGAGMILSLTGGGNLYTYGTISTGNELVPDTDVGGLCLQQNAGTGILLSGKSTSVAHGLTTRVETDTYLAVSKYSPTNGGVWLRGYSASVIGLMLSSEAVSASTSDTTPSGVMIDARKSSGTTTVALAATENILTIGTDSVTKVAVKGDGTIVSQAGLKLTAAANTAVGPLNAQIILPNTLTNRGGYSLLTAAGGSLAGMAAEVMTVGGGGVAVGKLDLWVQNAGLTNIGLSIAGSGAVTIPGTLNVTGALTAALTGNASTATTLQTARTLWGQSFNGSANISGAMSGITTLAMAGALSGVTTLAMSGQLTNTLAIGTAPFVITSTTRVANLNVATAGTADTLTTARTINGTSFNGSANITTANWGTSRNLTIGSTAKAVDGSGNVSWSLAEIGAAPLTPSLNNQTGTSYTLALSDAGINVTMNNAAANTLTIPANATIAFPVGTVIKITQLGAGQTTIAIDTDTLNRAAAFTLKLAQQYSEATITKMTSTMWVLSGDLELA